MKCSEDRIKQATEWNRANKDRRKEITRRYREKNKAKVKQATKNWLENNRDRELEKARIKIREKRKNQEYKDTEKEYNKTYRQNNKEHINEYWRSKYRNDNSFRLVILMRARLNKYLKGRSKRVNEILGCSPKLASLILEAQCLAYSNMSWVNHGEWHIDHIRPLCSFDLTNEHDLLECCHIKNLQPLWAHDNQTKSSKYETN